MSINLYSLIIPMKNLTRLLAALFALSLGVVAFADDHKKEACKDCKDCSECCKDGKECGCKDKKDEKKPDHK